MVEEGIRRLAAYQDRPTPRSISTGSARRIDAADLLREVARHLAVRMSFEDVIRVAQAKTSPERSRACAPRCAPRTHEPVEITEHFKPGIEEIAAILPPAGRRAGWAERAGRLASYFSMHVRTHTVWGFLRLRLLAGLRWWRPRTWRYTEEQAEIERWLEPDPRRRSR